MATQLTAHDAKLSLNGHVFSKGEEICARFGPALGWKELGILLGDRTLVRYPVEIAFDAVPLHAGECAHPVAKGERPEDGFTMFVGADQAGNLLEVGISTAATARSSFMLCPPNRST